MSRYARAIGNTTSMVAELWVLRDSINLYLSLNLCAMEIELDAKLDVDLLKKEGGNPNGNDVIVIDCREGLMNIPLAKIQHCYRKANKCIDALARRGALLSQDFVVFPEPPAYVALLISLDLVGTLYNCFTSCTLVFYFRLMNIPFSPHTQNLYIKPKMFD